MYEREPVLHQMNRLLKKRWCDVNAPLPMGSGTARFPLQDLAAVAAAARPELCRYAMRYGAVDLKGRLTFGMLVIDINNRLKQREEEMNIRQICDLDREALVRLLYKK